MGLNDLQWYIQQLSMHISDWESRECATFLCYFKKSRIFLSCSFSLFLPLCQASILRSKIPKILSVNLKNQQVSGARALKGSTCGSITSRLSLKKCLVVSVLSDGKRHLTNRNKPSLFPRLKWKFGKPSCLLSTSLDCFGRRAGWWCVCCPINCFCQLNTDREHIPNKS